MTGSIGIAVINKDHHNVDEILAQADAAMYGAKDGGRNTYRFFNTTLQHAMEQKLSLNQLYEWQLMKSSYTSFISHNTMIPNV